MTNINKDPYQYIYEKCIELDIPIAKLCRKLKVSRSTINKWQKKPPKTATLLYNIEMFIEKTEQTN